VLLFILAATGRVSGVDEKLVPVGDGVAAVQLKRKLAKLANEQPRLSAIESKAVGFGALSRKAEWPVFVAFAKLVGPVCVASEETGLTTKYSFPDCSSVSTLYIYHNDDHFQRLLTRQY
jgi:hypothetical protein